MKRLLEVRAAPDRHWVGDGFPVRSVITPRLYDRLSPFLLMDYAEPYDFGPSDKPRGVDVHPHKGFETVTVVFQGELEHRDSAGNSGRIGPGDVQWMTAGSGILHEEKHGEEFAMRGGTFEVAQLWVNLRASDKSAPPGYQDLLADRIPSVSIAGGFGEVRVIAGNFNGTSGPARTFTPIELWRVSLSAGTPLESPIPEGHSLGVFVTSGEVALAEDGSVQELQLAIFDRAGAEARIEAAKDSTLLVLGGEPIDEPVAAYGPFVMNTQEEIRAAVEGFQSGRMGSL